MDSITINVSTAISGQTNNLQRHWLHQQQLKILAALFGLPALICSTSYRDFISPAWKSGRHLTLGNDGFTMLLSGSLKNIPSLFGLLCIEIRYDTQLVMYGGKGMVVTSYMFRTRNTLAQLYMRNFLISRVVTKIKHLQDTLFSTELHACNQ